MGSVEATAGAAAAGNGDGDDSMGVGDRPTAGGVGGGGATAGGSALSAGGGLKRPLDPLADGHDALETVRVIRRRLVLGGGDDDDDGNGNTGGARGRSGGGLAESSDGAAANGSAVAETSGSNGSMAKARGEGARLQISNADLAELLRSTKAKGDPRRWAKVLYRAQNTRQGAHAGGERRKTVSLRG